MAFSSIFSFQIYSLISTILVIIRIIDCFRFNCDIFQVCISLFSSNKDLIILGNFGVMILLQISRYISQSVLKISIQSLKEQIAKKFSEFFVQFFLMIYLLSPTNIPFEVLWLSILPLYIYYLYLVLDETIKNFMSTQPNIEVRQHQNIFTLEIILFYITLKSILYLCSLNNNNVSIQFFYKNLVYNSATVLVSILRTILNHIYFLRLKNKHATLFDNFMIQVTTDSNFLAIKALILGIYAIYIVLNLSVPAYIYVDIFYQIYGLIREILIKTKTKKFVTVTLNQYPSPTEEEISNDDICIICRTQMTITDSKKLPCGHIFHKDCIIQWFSNKDQCPICKTHIELIPTNRNDENLNENQ